MAQGKFYISKGLCYRILKSTMPKTRALSGLLPSDEFPIADLLNFPCCFVTG